MSVILVVSGLVLLVGGAEALVRGAANFARHLGMSTLLVGLTIVAFGTSFPELSVSAVSALRGSADIAYGNVIGSNILNTLLILGIAAVIQPLRVNLGLIRADVPVMIGASTLAWFLSRDLVVGRLDGLILLGLLALFTAIVVVRARREPAAPAAGPEPAAMGNAGGFPATVPLQLICIVGGLGLLVVGSDLFVRGAIRIARSLGVSELVTGLTIVAAGTSLPELSTSIVAAIRGERDIAVANVVGSNIFNILGVLGVAALVAPGGVGAAREALEFDAIFMIVVAVACLPVFFTGGRISRAEGAVFIGLYVAYTILLIAGAAIGPESRRLLLASLSVPILVLTVMVVVRILTVHRRRHGSRDR